ncbi:LIM domain-containing protein WLIM1 [Hibiscus syriacus]|uniref:LIM domain-containing protein WLIM1 n=1 Tax=Hibiscus syriacus TaxID=106335 RepID=A0A6A2X580_HIBSY|nr:LIM domain-containing protein WLIM1 [Hibiscus syriacus]
MNGGRRRSTAAGEAARGGHGGRNLESGTLFFNLEEQAREWRGKAHGLRCFYLHSLSNMCLDFLRVQFKQSKFKGANPSLAVTDSRIRHIFGKTQIRPHYDQLFKGTGSLDKSFEGTPKIVKPEKQIENENAHKVVNLFGGTKEKCVGCCKTVYPIEKVAVDGTSYHISCFKCSHGGCTISPSNYIAHEGKLYCKHHHIQLFKEKGNYSQLEGDKQEDPITEKLTSLEVAAES